METIEVARIVGVTPGTLRVWERKQMIGPIAKDARGWRTWTEWDVVACRELLRKMHGDQRRSGSRTAKKVAAL